MMIWWTKVKEMLDLEENEGSQNLNRVSWFLVLGHWTLNYFYYFYYFYTFILSLVSLIDII